MDAYFSVLEEAARWLDTQEEQGTLQSSLLEWK